MGGGDTLSKYIRDVSLKEENKRTNLCGGAVGGRKVNMIERHCMEFLTN